MHELKYELEKDQLLYTQKYVSDIINVSLLNNESKNIKDTAIKILNEGYDNYIKHIESSLSIKNNKNSKDSKDSKDNKKSVTKEVVKDRKKDNLTALKQITTHTNGSVRGFNSITELINSVKSVISKEK
jgi:hypothetical protein